MTIDARRVGTARDAHRPCARDHECSLRAWPAWAFPLRQAEEAQARWWADVNHPERRVSRSVASHSILIARTARVQENFAFAHPKFGVRAFIVVRSASIVHSTLMRHAAAAISTSRI